MSYFRHPVVFYPRHYARGWGWPYYARIPVVSSVRQDLKVDISATGGSSVNVNINQLISSMRPVPRRF